MTRSTINPDHLHGADVTGHDGAKLGTVDNVYLDNETHQPEWAAVESGLFGTHISLVPLANPPGHLVAARRLTTRAATRHHQLSARGMSDKTPVSQ